MFPRLLRRARAALVRCPADCGQADPVHTYRDVSFADGLISPDQARIALALPPLLGPGTRLLHVGVGCSDLAVTFAAAIARIDGITVMADEHATAEALALPNYQVWTMNKHALAFAALPGPYDLIVDNNPGSFACCRRHFRFTVERYARLLAPGGRLLTDERGARWRQPGGLSLRWREWARVGRSLGLKPERVSETVWAWRKPGG
ncbi:MAG: hypothetical protein Q8P18_01385 [Pseudomonadota bacterium]|nr:hypothetical protein [Pseudomonadota bacterium]